MNMLKGRLGEVFPVLITLVIVVAIVALGALILPKIPSAQPAPSDDDTSDGATIAVIAGYIPTFGATIGATGLGGVLNEDGPFTVFVPYEGSTKGLSAEALQTLMMPENEAALRAVISHHIVLGKFTVADLKGMTSLQTLDGKTLDVRTSDTGVIRVNGARIWTPDLMATNGVIHVVNAWFTTPD